MYCIEKKIVTYKAFKNENSLVNFFACSAELSARDLCQCSRSKAITASPKFYTCCRFQPLMTRCQS